MEEQPQSEANLLNLQAPAEIYEQLDKETRDLEELVRKKTETAKVFKAEQELLNKFCNEVYLIESRAITKLREQLHLSEKHTIQRQITEKIKQEEQAAQKRLKTQLIYEKMQSDSRIQQRLHLEEKKTLDRLQTALTNEKDTAKVRLDKKILDLEEEYQRSLKSRLDEKKQKLSQELHRYRESLERQFAQRKKELEDRTAAKESLETKAMREQYILARKNMHVEFQKREELILEAEKTRHQDDLIFQNTNLTALRDQLENSLNQNLQSRIEEIKQDAKRKAQLKNLVHVKKTNRMVISRKRKKLWTGRKTLLTKSLQLEAKSTLEETYLKTEQPKQGIPIQSPGPSDLSPQEAAARQVLTRSLLGSEPKRVRVVASSFTPIQLRTILTACDPYSRRNIGACLPDLPQDANQPTDTETEPASELMLRFSGLL